jgi:dimethylargininase
MGCLVERLPAGPDMPDSVFIEDAAVVLDEVAIVTRPGAPSRRVETPGVAAALASRRPIVQIQPPGTVDGGDVLVVGRSILVGRTGRTNQGGFDQMRRALEPFGYDVEPASVRGCLHLKSAVTAVGEAALLINRDCVSQYELVRFELINVDAAEPSGANVVRVGARLLCAAAFPRTRDLLETRGYAVTTVDASELAKAEGALTCCSLIFRATTPDGAPSGRTT